MPLAPGSRLGPYEIVASLGTGGMGDVFRARDVRLGREVAIKRIRAEAAEDSQPRFWREARAAAAITHPNVCSIFDVGEHEGQPWLAMELLEGESLETRLARGPLPAEDAIARMLEILDGLGALHVRGIVHRDLKPSNIFLTPHGAKLLDLGLALPTAGPLGDETRLTRDDLMIGTPRYMAPEQWRSEPVSPATDLFACGALLFEMLTGAPAFRGETPIAIYEAVTRDQPPALAGGAGIEGLDRILQRALAKRPEDRFGSAAEMAVALREAGRAANGIAAAPLHTVLRLVVVPFRLLRPDEEIDFLSPALAEAISGRLSGLGDLAVRSPRLVGGVLGDDLPALAHRAQVDVALLGSLLRAGTRVRASAELVEVPGGAVRWSGSAEASTEDLFSLVDELARQVAGALRRELGGGASGLRAAGDAPADRGAYELYLRALELGRNISQTSSLVTARDLLARCVERDPAFAPAWAHLGRIHRVLGKYGHAEREESVRQARQAFERALALAPDLPLAHNLYTNFEIENLASPVSAMLRLLGRTERRSADAELYAGLVTACRYCGLLEASIAAHDRARRLDPGVPSSVQYTHWLRGDYQRAHDTDDEPMGFIRSYALPILGRPEEALAIYRSWSERFEEGIELVMAESSIALLTGDRATALDAARRTITSGFADPEGIYFVVRQLAKLDAVDEALDQLERIVHGGFTVPLAFRGDPWLAPLGAVPRFAAVLAEADAAHRHAAEMFERAGGPRLLGVLDPTLELPGSRRRP